MIMARAGIRLVQCLAVMVDRLRAVDFVVRGERGSESECLSLLNDVLEEWTGVVEKHSPGTEYKMAYLSRKHLTERKDQPAACSEEKVEKAKRKGRSASVAYDYKHVETLTDLLVFNSSWGTTPCLHACHCSCCLGPMDVHNGTSWDWNWDSLMLRSMSTLTTKLRALANC